MRNNKIMSNMRMILKTLMDRAGDNAHDIFRKTGIQPSTIYRYFQNEKSDLKSETVKKLARLYGITESQLRGDVPIEGMETPPEQLELKDLLTLDEYRHVNNLKCLDEDSRNIVFRMAEMLVLAEPQAPYGFEENDRRNGDRRREDKFPNPQKRVSDKLSVGDRLYARPQQKRRLKNNTDGRHLNGSNSSQTA